MAIPESEIKAWNTIFGEEFRDTPTPYYGINLYDVPVENWEKFRANIREQHVYLKLLSGRSHLWAVRDHGSFKRVVWINYYPEGAKPSRPGAMEILVEEGVPTVDDSCRLITSYHWFAATEVDGGPDALF